MQQTLPCYGQMLFQTIKMCIIIPFNTWFSLICGR